MKRLLIVDDDVELCDLVSEYLNSEGFAVDCIHDGPDAVERILTDPYELVILDGMIPGMNGFEILRRVRSRSRIPVLMLTARGNEVDRIVGLEIGADDYLPKPFNPRELVARIRAILRRIEGDDTEPTLKSEPAKLKIDDLELDVSARMLRRESVPVDLTSVEFDLLEAMMRMAEELSKRGVGQEAGLGREWESRSQHRHACQ